MDYINQISNPQRILHNALTRKANQVDSDLKVDKPITESKPIAQILKTEVSTARCYCIYVTSFCRVFDEEAETNSREASCKLFFRNGKSLLLLYHYKNKVFIGCS